jgi:V8-like Glu-specific endopeptidase
LRNQPLTALLVIISALSAAPAFAKVSAKVIYGDDNRRDYFEVPDAAWKQRADATVALIRSASLDPAGAVTNIKTVAYGQGMGLCATEPFFEQETAAFCSGFLVAPDTIVTAGHCVRTQASCESTKFVFGFKMATSGQQPRSVSSDMVFNCSKLIHSVSAAAGEDFAVVKLDRPVTHVSPLAYRTADKPAEGDPLVVIGHPAGLPLKVADGANVRKVNPEFMVANLDTYGGNSGSAVFNGVTGEIEGVLVRGEMDFVYQNGCRISKRCDAAGCRGEDVTLFERVRSHL